MTIPDDDNAPSGGDEGDERMTSVEILLPEGLAREARRAGLFDPALMAQILRKHLRLEAFRAEHAARPEASSETPMTTEEIQAEIDAYRASRRRPAGS